MTRNSVVPISASAVTLKPVVVNGRSFALNGANVSYRFHVDEATGDLITDHFGGIVTEDPVAQIESNGGGWSTQEHLRRELPDLGRGDFRVPGLRIKHDGHTVTHLKYDSHTIIDGKPGLPGLPSTFGKDEQVTTLVIRMCDSISSITADISYSIFPKHDAIARSVKVTNNGQKDISVEKLASFSVDFHSDEYEMLHLQGEWARECSRTRRKVDYGLQGFGSTTGYSSHYNNPFLGVVSSATTESHGDAWGFSLIYTGSFKAEVERAPQGLVRALIGMNPDQLSWPLKPGESLTTPECVAVFSGSGIGSMSRKFHRLFRQHLITSKFVNEPRPTLLNSWEGLYFDYDEDTIYKLAQESADLGAKLFVLDDGWFGVKYPRDKDDAGLGDWDANPAKFPGGLKPLADKVIQLESSKSSEDQKSEKLRFGLWFEPEMVNPRSTLYQEHPDWALHAGEYARSETRNQLVLNVALPEVQDYIIESVSKILRTVPVTYIKWDNNRAMHESPSPANYHAYILGLYRILNKLTSQFPNVLWEGCAAGGGRFDPGILHYFPQVWTSDNQDALDRIHIQFGTSLVYPASTMGAHIAAVPCEVNGRVTPIRFRAHVAMMGGSFGLELNPAAIPPEERAQLPELIALSEKVNPIVVQGDMYRLSLPEHSNHPTALFLSEDGSRGVLFAFQILVKVVHSFPMIRLQGLDPAATYKVDGKHAYSGATLMNGGIRLRFKSDFDSKVVFIERL